MKKKLDHFWYSSGPLAFFLWPLSWLYCIVATMRGVIQRRSVKPLDQRDTPVIVVGNISVGGTGKTPMVIWLVNLLKAYGMNPGIVSRGYKGTADSWPQRVSPRSNPVVVGDEAVIISQQTGRPMYTGPDRVACINKMTSENHIDIIISDDGLQHYKMPRDIEIIMIDGVRRFGNQLCLPAGPLRETTRRLEKADFLVTTGSDKTLGPEYSMQLIGKELINIRNPHKRKLLRDFRDEPVHAVAGIGYPPRFFSALSAVGLKVVMHPFKDHHVFSPNDFRFKNKFPVIMTEKDAVKCKHLAGEDFWYLPVKAKLGHDFGSALIKKLKVVQRGKKTA